MMGKTATNPKRKLTGRQRDEQILQAFWQRLGEKPYYPTKTEDVIRLLEANEFKISRGKVDHAVNRGELHKLTPENFAGRTMWQPTNIVALISLADSRRWWTLGPAELHATKMSRSEYGRQLAKQRGGYDKVAEGVDQYDVRDLVLLLMGADNTELQEQIFTAIEIRLEQLGIT